MRFRIQTFTLLFLLVCLLPGYAQVKPVYDRGAMGLAQIVKRLNTSASALMIGAHPDDEDTAMLAYLARGEGARTAYFSLTRGDGGQNIIGPELGEALGVIRTEELAQARRLDGAEQFFGRAYDYGFSKTLAEARSKWEEPALLCDAVRVIREFRPLVVLSQFTGTPADGHGQHQFAGYLAPLAVKAAADASQCTDAGPVWSIRKFYVRHRGQGEPTLRVNTGKYDPVLGRSYFEIAMEARSQHKSQEQGVLELRGEQLSGYNLVGSTAKENNIFDGLDLNSATAAPTVTARLAHQIQILTAKLNISDKLGTLTDLAEAYRATNQALQDGQLGLDPVVLNKRRLIGEAIALVAGVQIDALADRETIVPGETIFIGAKAFTNASDQLKVTKLQINAPQGARVESARPPTSQSPAFVSREVAAMAAYFTLHAPGDANWTQPYWLMSPRRGDMFAWNGPKEFYSLPFQPRSPTVTATLDVFGTEVTLERPVEYRYADDIRGEIRRNVDVVPALSVELDQSMIVVPLAAASLQRRVVATITNNTTRPISGKIVLMTPPEWKLTSEVKTFDIQQSGGRSAISFNLALPRNAAVGSFKISAAATVDDRTYDNTMRVISYPHIQTRRFYKPAVTDLRLIDVKTSKTRIGYIAGSGDRVPEAIRQMGYNLEMISPEQLASGDLDRYDSIVVGIRAYQVRQDVVANNKRLLDYANAGGNLVIQYQLPSYAAQQRLLPFPAQMGPRVSDETAKITILKPEHPLMSSPNPINAADFDGWVQERNLYNFMTMDPKYVGLLEAHDEGEAPNNGGLVVADVGRGRYVYTSYSFFRQLPAGVPGAYRLFSNIIGQPRR
jgi:LmbE family N-acetylglucosaminyl deacetylase